MAYFDSSKNRALWEIRLGQLRKERQLRDQGGTGDAFMEAADQVTASKTRVRVTYQELLKEEAMASEKSKRGRMDRDMERDRTRTQTQTREREGMRNEMG